MYVIFNIIRIKPEFLKSFIENVYRHAENSSREPGCIRYEVMQDHTDPHIVCLYEVFRDEAAFNEHRSFDHYKHWMEISRDWREQENRIRHVLGYIYGPEQAGLL